jgi:hypothetical protein
MMREKERGIIGLGSMKKRAYKLLLFEPNQSQLKLSLFNYRVRLTRVRIDPELNHKPELFYTALFDCMILLTDFDGSDPLFFSINFVALQIDFGIRYWSFFYVK